MSAKIETSADQKRIAMLLDNNSAIKFKVEERRKRGRH